MSDVPDKPPEPLLRVAEDTAGGKAARCPLEDGGYPSQPYYGLYCPTVYTV